MFCVKIIFLFLFLTLPLQGQEILPPSKMPRLSTKQDVNNLRFLSEDGKYTYYQRRSGTLVFATNFEVNDVLEGPLGTQYNITSTPTRKFLAVSVNEHFFTYLDATSSNKIYTLPYGTNKASLLGEGRRPRLHLNDSWISFYDAKKREIHFINIESPVLRFHITLPPKKNPYFSPHVVMANDQLILYTDQNESGFHALAQFDRGSKKSSILRKMETPFRRMELCLDGNNLFLGIFNLHAHRGESSILRAPTSSLSFSPLYTSPLSDLGHLLCHGEVVYFIKAQESGSTELAELDPSKPQGKNIRILSDLREVSQVINMDGKILIPFRGTFYVARGKGNYINTERLKGTR